MVKDLSSVRVGEFVLGRLLGRGGMGAVWAGRHCRTGREVAIKVLLRARGQSARWRAAFDNEVRTVARLDHPHVVSILARGEVGPGARDLPVGAPYLVMDKADRTLSDAPERAALHRWVRPVLQALAHAHARGVLHRDLKPSNVLVAQAGERARFALADFGVALDELDGVGEGGPIWGTPGFMAPELLKRRDWPQGPWTDLYALGCVIHHVLGGQIPADLRPWLSTLLQASPRDRFSTAADALHALEDHIVEDALPEVSPPPLRPTLTRRGLAASPSEHGVVAGSSAMVPTPAPQPEDWRTPYVNRTVRWEEEGLSLFGVRAVPYVGRETERDQLWSGLASCASLGRPRAMLLRGPAGIGKSRLARWLCERALETGAARCIRASHSDIPGSADGVWPAIGRFLSRGGVAPLRQRIGYWVGDDGIVDRIIERLRGHQVLSLGEEGSLLEAVLAAIAHDRPVVLWVDDVQWAPESLALVEGVLAAKLPVYVILTAREESLREQPELWRQLDRLLAAGRIDGLELGPLSTGAIETMLRTLAGLQGQLLGEVGSRVAGNPLFAVQLVTDWVERGILRSAPGGFRLASGARVELPEHIFALWASTLDRLLQPGDLLRLELLAALGQDTDAQTWTEGCARAGRTDPGDLLTRLADRGLLHVAPASGRVSFVHGMVRESVLARAEAKGRLQDHYALCSELTREPLRSGHLLLRAGRPGQAAPLLWGVVRADMISGHRLSSLVAVRWFREALDAMGVPASDPRRGDARLAQGRILLYSGRAAEAEIELRALVESAREHAWEEVGFWGTAFRTLLCQQATRFAEAEALLEEMRSMAEKRPGFMGHVLFRESWLHMRQGRMEQARRAARAASERPWSTEAESVTAQTSLMILLSKTGEADAAASIAQALIAPARARRAWNVVADCANCMGEIARSRGDLVAAEAFYREAQACHRRIGSRNLNLSTANLGMVLLANGCAGAAGVLLLRAVEGLREQGRVGLTCVVSGLLCQALVAARDRVESARVSQEIEEMSRAHSGLSDPELAEALHAAFAAVPADPAWSTVRIRLQALAAEHRRRLREP